ncbi:MAG: MATE family efflux transporter [Pilosibacter sp.]
MSKNYIRQKSNIDMTQGVIWNSWFCNPADHGKYSSVQLYNTVDSIVVGNYLGTSALAAVGATTAICNTLVNFFTDLDRCRSCDQHVFRVQFPNHEKLHEVSVETTILFAVIVGCFVSLISVWVVPLMLNGMSTPDDVIGPAGEYLKIYILPEFRVLFLYGNMSSAILRAVGDTKRPLNFLIISSCLNIAWIFSLLRNLAGDQRCRDRLW